ncbi:hypothetical protein OTU49_000284 [Cherax quadricarinatus]|uniref:Uncharacterized protein n=1 Tax=Cherax quadricarinatus TaxID=27406 RepID=A0AAW0Y147_CHEQU
MPSTTEACYTLCGPDYSYHACINCGLLSKTGETNCSSGKTKPPCIFCCSQHSLQGCSPATLVQGCVVWRLFCSLGICTMPDEGAQTRSMVPRTCLTREPKVWLAVKGGDVLVNRTVIRQFQQF